MGTRAGLCFFLEEKIPFPEFELAVLPARSLVTVLPSASFRLLHILHIRSLCLNQFGLLIKLLRT